MKKIIAALSALMVLTTGVSTTAFAVGDEYDFNGDGVTNSMDMSVFWKYLLTDGGTKSMKSTGSAENDKYFENIELTDDAIAKIKAVGDVNNDKKIDGFDSSDLIKKFFKEGVYVSDVNKDGKLEQIDAQLVADYYGAVQSHSIEKFLTAEERNFIVENCNYDGDYQISALDASFLSSYLADVWRETYEMGDTNLDGVVDAVDASIVLTRYSRAQTHKLGYNGDDVESEEITNAYIIVMGDINNDGAINALDASLILSAYADAQTK